MKLTRAADFAIRLLTRLAQEDRSWTNRELSKELDIPLNHLSKLVQQLSRRQFLLTRKGRGGGVRLAVDPKKINMADVVEVVEGPVIISDCIFNRRSCRFSKKCKARKCLGDIRNKIHKMLADTCIQDLVVTNSK
jgi:Rrf2 family protein